MVVCAVVVAGCGSSAGTTTTPKGQGSFADLVAKVRSGVVRVEVDLCEHRTIQIGDTDRRRLVQTDAAVNKGNSGGPLIALGSGEVVGLVDAGTTEANGLAFAVSSQVARPLVDAWEASPQPNAPATCAGSSGAASASGGGAPAGAGGSQAGVNHAYADDLDDALVASARTRRGLGELIAHVNDGSASYQEANSTIQAIVDQRRQLLAAVDKVPAPSAFQPAAALLRHALSLSIADDLAIESWIDATYQGDTAGASRYFHSNIRLSATATAAKQAFLTEYNRQRKRLLDRSPLDVQF